MKVLILTEGYFPAQTYGGPPVSINNLCSLLHESIDFYIICYDHELNSKNRLLGISEGWNDRGNCKVMYLNDRKFKFGSLKKLIQKISPDCLYVNSLFSKYVYKVLILSRLLSIPLLVAPRGELCVNAFDKKWKKIPYLKFFYPFLHTDYIYFQSTSDEETQEIKRFVGINDNKIVQLSNIASIPSFICKKETKEQNSCNLVFISRIQSKKNLLYALNVLKKVKGKVSFDIYGPLENKKYWEECQRVIKELPNNIMVTYKGALKHDEVGKTFAKYHAFFFPTLSENYGHVIVEAMLNKCPIITSDQVPWTDVNDNQSGWSIPLENEALYVEAIENICKMNANEYNSLVSRCINYVNKKLDIEKLKKSYFSCFLMIRNLNREKIKM